MTVFVTVLVLLGTLGRLDAQKSAIKNERWGFKINKPRGYTEMPLKVDEQWLGAKLISDKTYLYNNKERGWSYEFRPEIMVIGFLKNQDEEEVSGEDVLEELEKGKEVILALSSPYKDYEEYLDGTYTGGGFYISSRKESKQGDLSVTEIEVKVEKLTTTGPKRIITWVYHTEDIDYAVHFEVLEGNYKKLSKTIRKVMRSFALIERTGDQLKTQTGQRITFSMMDEGTPADRRKARMESERQYREAASKNLPDGWSVEDHKTCFVLTHVKKKDTKKVVDQVTGVMAWLSEQFPFVGPDEYVRAPIIRICADQAEYSSFSKGGDGMWNSGIEIVTYVDREGWGDFTHEQVGANAMRHWFGEHDRSLFYSFPSWLSNGLREFVGDMRFKRRKFSVRPDTWGVTKMKERVSSGIATKPKKLIKMNFEAYRSAGYYEADSLVRYLLDGKASKKSQTKTIVRDYVQNLQRFRDRVEEDARKLKDAKAKAEETGEAVDAGPYGEKAAETEEEEAAQFKRRREKMRESEQTMLDEVFTRTFGHWDQKDWERFNKSYFDAI